MRHAPGDVDWDALADALRRHWGIDPNRMDYAPLGYGSHHWDVVGTDGSRWFVSADELRDGDETFAKLDRAFRTAAALRDRGGLEFVLAPVRSGVGAGLHRLGGRYAIRAEPFVEACRESRRSARGHGGHAFLLADPRRVPAAHRLTA